MQHERQRVPVTALAFLKQDFILSGEGTYLCAYDQELKRCKSIRVFESQAIHGINVRENQRVSTVLVWGGSLVRLVYIQQDDRYLNLTPANLLTVHDWILDAAFAPSEEQIAAVATAHNALWTVRTPNVLVSENGKPEASSKHEVAGSNCILYSAHVLWLSSSRCLIASGTAFGDVIVWSANLHDGNVPQYQTHYTFSAHEGSVFGVQLSSNLHTTGLNCERALATCSDDRTIRLWDISDLTLQVRSAVGVQNETGFSLERTNETIASQCIAKVMGHTSRIWHLRFSYSQTTDEPLKILSFGEDTAVITWTLTSMNNNHVLRQSVEITPHAGKNIWAVAMDNTSNLVITGGADGAIAMQHLGHDILSIKEIPRALLHSCDQKDSFRSYSFVGPGALLGTTDRGRVVLIDCTSDKSVVLTEEIEASLPGLEGYSSVSSSGEIAFIGGGDGVIYVYAHRTRVLSKLAQTDRKIAGLFVSEELSGQVVLLATNVGSAIARLITMAGLELELTADLLLPQSFVTTSFVHFTLVDVRYAILGSRHGSLAVYKYHEALAAPVQLVELYTEVHGKDAVTALRWMAAKERSDSGSCGWLLSIGRDGTFAVHVLRLYDPDVKLQLVHQLSLPIGPNLEGLHLNDNGNLFALGFKSKHFVCYNVTEQREMMKVECGGAHRNWAFQLCQSGGGFVWTKASQVFHAEQIRKPYQLVNSGAHGREIKAVAISTFNSQHLIATGGEDTDIKLFTIQRDGFNCIQTLRKHNTGIQHLRWHQSHLFSCGGFEEFYVWRTTPNIPHITIGVVCESKHPRTGASDLRIVGFDVVNAVNDASLVITMAYSDSTLKVWRYVDRSWWLAATADYLTSCLTHAFRIGCRNTEIFTTATDGHIARWSVDSNSEELEWLQRYRVHQNAIHEVVHIDIGESGTSLIITGGDDNAIGITRIGKEISATTLLVSRAHAAAVTGLATLAVDEATYLLVSASIDQRVKLWRLDVDVDQSGVDCVEVELVQDVFTAVADVSKLEVCQFEDGNCSLLVCGVGIDMWRIPSAQAFATQGQQGLLRTPNIAHSQRLTP